MTPEKSGSLRAKLMPSARAGDSMISLRYEETLAAKPPIPVTVAPPRAPPTDTHPALRRPANELREEEDDWKRDSGLAPTTTSSKAGGEGSVTTVDESVSLSGLAPSPNNSAMKVQSAPQIPPRELPTTKVKRGGSVGSGSAHRWRRPASSKGSEPKTPPALRKSTSAEQFSPITTLIPTESLLEENFLDKLSFSKRGSVMLGGKKAINRPTRVSAVMAPPSFSLLVSPSPKALSDEVELESQKVRSMYEAGSSLDGNSGRSSVVESQFNIEEEESKEESNGLLSPNVDSNAKRPGTALSTKSESSVKAQHELAGGIEDWEDVNGRDVDRYGFISSRRDPSRTGTPEPKPPQRVSTALQLASATPRKKRAFGRSPSTAASSKSGYKRPPSRKVSAASLKSHNSGASYTSRRSHLRTAANRWPGNKDRRWMDEAGDMLTLPPGLADIAEDAEGGRAADSLKKREWERAEKWRKMATVVKAGKGEGMEFEFDTKNPKLIERTWKGIPDIWRAAAWHSFLSTSAKKTRDSATNEQIIEAFHSLQNQSSADDVQIDIDVPRTINSHIMFRKRYRGGQRLLFRVLHALSLYFPKTGYVQGMASLAATLLCYYDEDKTFVMLVRMWTLRGLEKLYESGFSGLMSALDEFQTQWLAGDEVSSKLVGIWRSSVSI